MAFAALGAGEVLRVRKDQSGARILLRDVIGVLDTPRASTGWPWPEPRLRYANAAVAEAVMVAGDALADKAVLGRGLGLLAFLLRVEIRQNHLSVTPVAGRGIDEIGSWL